MPTCVQVWGTASLHPALRLLLVASPQLLMVVVLPALDALRGPQWSEVDRVSIGGGRRCPPGPLALDMALALCVCRDHSSRDRSLPLPPIE